ncbi:hypothetical protein BaRGS_00000160 [Batillaria attramentaria]|uniref:BRCA1-associated RING domain protein 1 n=1 Tax=Batillaria attramentaria TaxID=370345 RepID=A0ABD0M9S2_9CAEN
MDAVGIIDTNSDFASTKEALVSLQRLLLCSQCNQLTRNVCTLGNCAHLFCKLCVAEHLGGSCPCCGMPAHARDAQVNKQLSNIVSLSLELERMDMSTDNDKLQENLESTPSVVGVTVDVTSSPSPASLAPTSYTVQDEAAKQADAVLQCQHNSTPSQSHREKHSKKKQRGSRKDENKTLTQVVVAASGHDLSAGAMDRSRSKGNSVSTEVRSSHQTRTRGRQTRRSTSSADASDLAKTSIAGQNVLTQFRHTDVESTDDVSEDGEMKDKGASLTPETSTPRRVPHGRGRGKQADDDHSTGTPSPSSSTSRRGSGRKSRSVPQTPPMGKAVAMTGTRNQNKQGSTPRTGGGGHQKAKTRTSPLFNTSPVKKHAGKTGGAGAAAGRVKRNAKGETPLHVAAIKGDVTAVRELLAKGDNPNVRDNAGWTPLHEAVNHGNSRVTELLLQHGAMVNMPGMDNDTPLHDAVCNNRLECARLLVTYGASTTARNMHGRTPTELAQTHEMRAVLQEPVIHKQTVTNMPEPEDMADFLPLCFLGTQLNRDQRSQLQKCATKLHAKVVDEYCCEVTHLVSWCNGDGQCPRTFKYLQAVLDGKWIVTIDWVNVCLEYGEKVSEEPFEIPGTNLQPNSNAPHKARLNRRQQLPKLFDGCQMYLHGSFTRLPPHRHELMELLRQGGAHILTREPRLSNLDEYEVTVPYHAAQGSSLADCGIFIVHDEGPNVPRINATRMRSVPASWILDCIATFSLVEPPAL